MKKLLSVLLALTLCLSLVACGGGENPSDDGKQTPPSETKDTEHSYEEDPDLPGVVRVNLTTAEYCANAPFTLIKRNGTSFKVETNSYAVLYDQYVDTTSDTYYEIDLNDFSSAEDVVENMAKQTASCLMGILARADEYSVKVNSKENVTVNGWDMCKQKGAIELTHRFPLPYQSADFVAYSLIKDGYPIYIMVVDKPDGPKRIDIEEMADKIVKTFREYSKD